MDMDCKTCGYRFPEECADTTMRPGERRCPRCGSLNCYVVSEQKTKPDTISPEEAMPLLRKIRELCPDIYIRVTTRNDAEALNWVYDETGDDPDSHKHSKLTDDQWEWIKRRLDRIGVTESENEILAGLVSYARAQHKGDQT